MVALLILNVLCVAVDMAMLHAFPEMALLYASVLAFNAFVVGLLASSIGLRRA